MQTESPEWDFFASEATCVSRDHSAIGYNTIRRNVLNLIY